MLLLDVVLEPNGSRRRLKWHIRLSVGRTCTTMTREVPKGLLIGSRTYQTRKHPRVGSIIPLRIELASVLFYWFPQFGGQG